MMQITHPCRFCGKPAIARFEDDALEDAVNKFLPLLTHDHCADMLRKRNDSGDRIISLCFDYYRSSEKDKGKIIAQTRESLMRNSRRYAEAICEILHLRYVIWTEDFVDLLIERAGDPQKVLSRYREQVRQAVNGKEA